MKPLTRLDGPDRVSKCLSPGSVSPNSPPFDSKKFKLKLDPSSVIVVSAFGFS